MLTRFLTAMLYVAVLVLIGLWVIGMLVVIPANILNILYVIFVILVLLALVGVITGKFPPAGWPGAL